MDKKELTEEEKRLLRPELTPKQMFAIKNRQYVRRIKNRAFLGGLRSQFERDFDKAFDRSVGVLAPEWPFCHFDYRFGQE